jgi:hypothetical protein
MFATLSRYPTGIVAYTRRDRDHAAHVVDAAGHARSAS